MVDPETSGLALTLEASPTDGDDDGDMYTLGPFPILNDVTRWKRIMPNLLLRRVVDTTGFLQDVSSFVVFDDRLERFLVQDGSHLWEYTDELGFVELHPGGDVTPAYPMHTYFDNTEGAERLLVLEGKPSEAYKLYILDTSERGKESWTQMAITGGPSARCYPMTFFDAPSNRLFLMGGLPDCDLETSTNDDLWQLDVSELGSVWTPLSLKPGYGTVTGLFGATAVHHPTSPKVFLVGGYVNSASASAPAWTPANVVELTLASNDGTPILNFEPGSSVGEGWGPVAFVDAANNRIIGGLALDVSAWSLDKRLGVDFPGPANGSRSRIDGSIMSTFWGDFLDWKSTPQRLVLYGGLPDCSLLAAADEDIFGVNVTGTEFRWTSTSNKIGYSTGVFGSTAVHDSEADTVFLVGGYTNASSASPTSPVWAPSRSRKITLRNVNGTTVLNFDAIASTNGGWAPVAFYDDDSNSVVGGFGLDITADTTGWKPKRSIAFGRSTRRRQAHQTNS